MNIDQKPSYKPTSQSQPLEVLPFIAKCRENYDYWDVEDPESYEDGLIKGMYFGAHAIQFMKDNPEACKDGFITQIIADQGEIYHGSSLHAVTIGFYRFIERYVLAAAHDVDVFKDVNSIVGGLRNALATVPVFKEEDKNE